MSTLCHSGWIGRLHQSVPLCANQKLLPLDEVLLRRAAREASGTSPPLRPAWFWRERVASWGPLVTHRLPLCPQIMQLLTRGNRQRTQEPTAANKTSSRSHAVLQVTVRQRSRGADVPEEVRVGRLFMVDLAGSERASQVLCQPHSYSPCSLRAGLPLPDQPRLQLLGQRWAHTGAR